MTSTDYATTKQITQTPAREAGLTFAPDNRTLAYASERNGNWQLFLAKIARKEEANFPNATIIEEKCYCPPQPWNGLIRNSHRTVKNWRL